MITEFFREVGPRESDTDLERAWRYVGRFMWGFAIVESDVNEIFVELFNLNAGAALMFIPNLDLRKKLKLISVGLKDQDVPQIDDIDKTLKGVHKLADIRNIIAHFSFGPQIGGEGIFSDYVRQDAEVRFPDVIKIHAEESDTTIPHSLFDYYDAVARKLSDALRSMQGSFTPIADVSQELARDIAEIVAASDNIILFPERPRT
jgi:hypothetical protein